MESKDITIINVVKYLQDRFGVGDIIVKDHWDGDNCAIGLTNQDGNCLVYISTWQRKDNEYYVSLEFPSKIENEEREEVGEFDNVKLDRLVEIVREHLDLK